MEDPAPPNRELHEEFVALFVRHEAAIHSFVLALMPDFESAEEVVQQASMTMWRRFEQYEAGTSFRNWAFQVAKFTALNCLKTMRRDRHIFSQQLLELLADQAQERADGLDAQRRALNHCIERLADQDRQALATAYLEDNTIKAAAILLGQSPNSLYKQLNRIRAALLNCIERRLGLEGTA